MSPPLASARPPVMPTPPPPETSPRDRVPRWEKLAIGLGQAASMGTHNGVTTLANPIYNVTMGVNPAYVSTLTFVQRFWDAFLDPWVGQLSDNLRSRWGRRKPFLFAAALPMAIAFAAIWFFPRGASEFTLVGYFLGASLVFYLFHSFYTVPLTALQIEATGDYHERTRLASIVGICTWLFSLGNQWLYPLIESGRFADPVTGVRVVMSVAAVLFAFMACVPVFFAHERFRATAAAPKKAKAPFLQAMRETGRNRDFVLLLGVRSISQLGYSIVASLGFYLNIYLVHGGDRKAAGLIQGWLGTAYVLASIAAFWGFRVLAIRIGKRRALQVSAGFLLFGGLAKLIVYQPGARWLQLIVPATNGIAIGGIALLTTAMLADIVDADELLTRQRREGLYASVLSWLDKVGSSTGGLLSGFVLVWIGFNAKLGPQSPATLFWMKLVFAILPLLGGIATIVFANHYGLTEERAYAMKRELEKRRSEGFAA